MTPHKQNSELYSCTIRLLCDARAQCGYALLQPAQWIGISLLQTAYRVYLSVFKQSLYLFVILKCTYLHIFYTCKLLYSIRALTKWYLNVLPLIRIVGSLHTFVLFVLKTNKYWITDVKYIDTRDWGRPFHFYTFSF